MQAPIWSRLFIIMSLLLSSSLVKAHDVISQHVDIHAFSALIEEYADDETVHLIDVRTLKEYQQGHIAGAKVVDFYNRDFINEIKQLDKNHTYLLYCRSGNRSGKTLNLMHKLGFKAAYNMKGGMKAWTRANYPVAR